MSDTRPTLYLSRLLPNPVMAIVRERFQLVQEPLDTLPSPSALREGLGRSDAAIVTLGDCIDAETIHAATRLKILANYAVGYNNIDLMAARQRSLIVTNTPDVLTDATADLTWALLLATARPLLKGILLFDPVVGPGGVRRNLWERRFRARPWELSAWDGLDKR